MVDMPSSRTLNCSEHEKNRAMANPSLQTRLLPQMRFWVVLAWVALACGISTAKAAPVTLRFEGEIVEIESIGNPAFDLPSDITLGQPTVLELTFEPIPFPDAAETIGSFTSPGGHAAIHHSNLILSPSS